MEPSDMSVFCYLLTWDICHQTPYKVIGRLNQKEFNELLKPSMDKPKNMKCPGATGIRASHTLPTLFPRSPDSPSSFHTENLQVIGEQCLLDAEGRKQQPQLNPPRPTSPICITEKS